MKENFIKHKYLNIFSTFQDFLFRRHNSGKMQFLGMRDARAKKNKIEILCQKNLQSEKDVSAREKKIWSRYFEGGGKRRKRLCNLLEKIWPP